MSEQSQGPEIVSHTERSLVIGSSADTFFAAMEQYFPDAQERQAKYGLLLKHYLDGSDIMLNVPEDEIEEALRTVIEAGKLKGASIIINAANVETSVLSDQAIREGLGLNKEGEA